MMYSKVDLALLEFVENLEIATALGEVKEHYVGIFNDDEFIKFGHFETISECEEFIQRLTYAPFIS